MGSPVPTGRRSRPSGSRSNRRRSPGSPAPPRFNWPGRGGHEDGIGEDHVDRQDGDQSGQVAAHGARSQNSLQRASPGRGRAINACRSAALWSQRPSLLWALRQRKPIRPTKGAAGRGPAPLRGLVPGRGPIVRACGAMASFTTTHQNLPLPIVLCPKSPCGRINSRISNRPQTVIWADVAPNQWIESVSARPTSRPAGDRAPDRAEPADHHPGNSLCADLVAHIGADFPVVHSKKCTGQAA